MAKDTPPQWDRRMQQRLTRGEEAALGELYDRFAPLVHSLAHRVLHDDEAAGLVTRDVFAYVWENADTYEPDRILLRAWMARITQDLAVARLRETSAGQGSDEEREEKIRRATAAARADFIVAALPAPLRDALDLAYHQRRTYRQTAEDLNVTHDEARRRLRLGLQLLASANDVASGVPRRGNGPAR